jgi:hypothetical protein
MPTNTFANTALCQHPRFNNQPCGQPALRGRRYCRFHLPAHSKRPDYSLPMVEDAISLQYAVMQVIRALHHQAIDAKTAAITLYGLQIASGNLKRFLEEHQPSRDTAREKSLLELLADGFQIPRDEFINAGNLPSSAVDEDDEDELALLGPLQPPATITKSTASEE